jgi:hypothetical protein
MDRSGGPRHVAKAQLAVLERKENCARPQSPLPLSGITWFAFPALSKIVTLDDFGPTEVGPNCSISLHFFFGKSCAPQVVPIDLNSCGLVGGNTVIGLSKVIGGPFFA